MAETRQVDPFSNDFSGDEAHQRPIYRRVSTLNGLLIGLALGLGAWGREMLTVARLPVASYWPALLLGLGAVTLLCGFVGWLTGRIARTAVTVILWILVAVAVMLIMGYLPYQGRSLATWLIDPRFWGRSVFPFALEGGPGGLILGGLLIILVLAGLGLLQNYRLELISLETGRDGRLSGRAWLSLLAPMLAVFLASLITQSVMANPAAPAISVTHRALTVAQQHEGDLRTLNLGDGITYAAFQPVREQIAGDFTLNIVDVNPLNSTVIVGIDFTGGAWVNCRVINDQLSFCFDASPPYVEGLRALVTGQPPPEECRGCMLQATDEAAAWLAERRGRLADPTIERVAQQGSHVLMRVTGGDGYAVECWIEGVTPTRLTQCMDE